MLKKMKRNIELIRFLLLRGEGDKAAEAACEKFTPQERGYHIQLLLDAKLIEGVAICDVNEEFSGGVVSRLTWAGHDFIDAMRDESVWRKVKAHILKAGASWTFDLVKEWAKYEIKLKTGLPLT